MSRKKEKTHGSHDRGAFDVNAYSEERDSEFHAPSSTKAGVNVLSNAT